MTKERQIGLRVYAKTPVLIIRFVVDEGVGSSSYDLKILKLAKKRDVLDIKPIIPKILNG